MSEIKTYKCNQCHSLLAAGSDDPQWNITYNYYRNCNIRLNVTTDNDEKTHVWNTLLGLDFCSEDCVTEFINDMWEKRERKVVLNDV